MAEPESDFNHVNLRHPQGQTPRPSSTFNTQPNASETSSQEEGQPLYYPYDDESHFDAKHEPITYPPVRRVQEIDEPDPRRGFAKLHDSPDGHSAGRASSWDMFTGMGYFKSFGSS